MKTILKVQKLWQCPQCGRQFARQGQSHSCRPFALEQHFAGKPRGTSLYEAFKQAVATQIGLFKIESLECCIHFVGTSTFVAIKIFKDKIRVDFSLNHQIDNPRIKKFIQMSAHRFLYYLDIAKVEELDDTLMAWVAEAYGLH